MNADQLDAIRKGDLYALLSVCSDEDLDPLVKQILGRFSNFLGVDEGYKKHQPRHSLYTKAIADDLRRFGGNSFANLFRGGTGPSYDEIVVDVCKRLDIPYEKDRTLENERNLLNAYLERSWQALSEAERADVVASARGAATADAVNAKTVAKDLAGLVLTRAVAGPLLVPTTMLKIADPAFKVTVPCVLHVAYLRRKVLEGAPALPVPIPSEPAQREQPLERSEALVIGISETEPALILAQVSEPAWPTWTPVEEGDGISRLSPLLQAVPSLATAVEVSTVKYMEVVISGSLNRAKDGIGFRAMSGTRKALEHARLFNPTQLSNIVNASTLLHVASLVVAQKHLADISRKLSDIKTSIERIQQFQKNERRSALTGALRYFEQVAPSVLALELSDGIRTQLEAQEATLLQVQEHLLWDIRHESAEVMKLKDEGGFGSKGMEEAIRTHQKLLEDLYQQYLMCARACGWQLLTLFPGEARLKENRKHDIRASLDELADGGDLLRHTDLFMRRKVQDLSSIWNREVTVNERKLSLLEWNEMLLSEVGSTRRAIEQAIQAAERAEEERHQSVRLFLRLEGKRVVAMAPA
ncbi:MAG TPA: hypothetical protein VEY95_09510 [Azospirillaceae bacterium]|nr:hypothetical protein [Azospirillaceae bacterium]